MTKNCKPKQAVTIDGESLRVVPIPRRINLKTLGQVRAEMARVYRQTREGKIDTQDGSRFVYMLVQIGKMVELSELEKRLELLEKQNNGQHKNSY